jgi:hypothetical protein
VRLTENDIGILRPGMAVEALGRKGIVRNVHEPSWVDHRTKRFCKVLQSADVVFDEEPAYSNGVVPAISVGFDEIEIIVNKIDK